MARVVDDRTGYGSSGLSNHQERGSAPQTAPAAGNRSSRRTAPKSLAWSNNPYDGRQTEILPVRLEPIRSDAGCGTIRVKRASSGARPPETRAGRRVAGRPFANEFRRSAPRIGFQKATR